MNENVESLDVGGDMKKTPGTLALGVSCQPAGSESSLPIEKLPLLDTFRTFLRAPPLDFRLQYRAFQEEFKAL